MGDKTTRREFLKQVALTGAAITAIPQIASAAEKAVKGVDGKSRVIIASDPAVLKSEGEIVQSVLEKMLDRGVAKLTKTSTAVEGWKKLFSPDDVVGVKVNCLFGKGVSTHPEVTNAVVRGLMQAGVKPSNIIIWDRSTGDLIKGGYNPNRKEGGVLCYGDDGDWGEEITQGSFKGKITKIISETVTAIVNVPILKTHGISGISCCLKNHYGSFDNPGNHHKNHNTALADFSAIPMVKEKTRLVVIDALRPQCDGGPGYQADAQFDYHSLIVSADPVAADYQGMQIINEQRRKTDRDPLPTDKMAWLQNAQDRGVGVCDPGKIELIKV